MKVLHLSPAYFSSESILGGGERYVDQLARAMALHTSTQFISFGPRSQELMEGKLRVMIKKPLFYLDGHKLNPVALPLFKAIERHDIIHCHQIHTVLTEMAILTARLLRKKVFVTDHGGGGRTFFLKRGLLQKIDGFLAVSKYSLKCALLPESKKRVIYGGIDTEKFRPSFNGQRLPRRIVAVGRVLRHKGFHHLIRAITHEELVIIGSLSDNAYVTLLKQLSVGKKVRFIENATDQEMIETISTAQLAVCASTRMGPQGEPLGGEPELFGFAPLEAMACQTPTLVSDVGSYPEIAMSFDGKPLVFRDGDMASLKSQLTYLLGDRGLCLQLQQQARKHVENNFTWKRVVDRCMDAYEASFKK